jgi:replicative DNA helicase Mcm
VSVAEGGGPAPPGELLDKLFLEFFETFRDGSGEYKYRARLRRMASRLLAGDPSDPPPRTLVIDFSDLLVWRPEDAGRKLADLLVGRPDEALRAARLALLELAKVEAPDLGEEARGSLRVGVRGLPVRTPLRALGREHVGRLVSFEGMVVKSTKRYVYIRRAAWRCRKCGSLTYTESVGGRVVEPEACPYCGSSDLREDEGEHELADWRRITVQEPPEELPPGQVPVAAEVELFDDLSRLGNPGDKVVVTGVVRAVRRGRRDARIELAVEAVGLDVVAKDAPVQVTPEDEERIRELASRPDVEELIVASIAPSVHGLREVKRAIALQLFGGVPKVFPDGVRVRGDIHVLLVGDPGTAKSQLLKYAAALAPRGVYTTGKGATAAGLTAAVVKDPETGAYALEVGALVLADMGLCAIDEIDKMDARDRAAIHEAMEQQTVSVAKAGIVATLNARASVLAAANPAFGRYDPSRPLSENISLPPSLLSRFDLIFVVRDEPSREADAALAAHVRAHHAGAAPKPPIEPALLRKYIAYARATCSPRLTEEAGRRLEEFYVEMRQRAARAGSPVPITPRQLEAMIRLAEAHARMRLSPTVDERDAEAAIELVSAFLRSACLDAETGEIDIGIVMAGRPRSQAERMALLWDLLKRMHEEAGRRPVRREELVERARERGFDEAFVERALRAWYEQGMLIEPKPGYLEPVL